MMSIKSKPHTSFTPFLCTGRLEKAKFPSLKESLSTVRWCARPSFIARAQRRKYRYGSDAEEALQDESIQCPTSNRSDDEYAEPATRHDAADNASGNKKSLQKRGMHHSLSLTQQSCRTAQWLLLLLVPSFCPCQLNPVLTHTA